MLIKENMMDVVKFGGFMQSRLT